MGVVYRRVSWLASTCLTISTVATALSAQAPIQPPSASDPGTGAQATPSAATPAASAGATGVPATTPSAASGADNQEIIVTGSLFKRAIDTATPSPVTTLSAATLQQRGVNTIAGALATIPSNGAGTLPNSFSANGAFAAGASAVSLRGLTTNSSIVLFDGLRGAYYPLADDGARSFVDLNTIPDAIVERVEVLKDGASSTYGADAIAGVVNVITKKEIKGVSGTLEGGLSSRHDAGQQRATLTAGFGDLKSQGFNFYVSGEYQHDQMLLNNARGYPFNTGDIRNTPSDNGTPGPNNNQNGQGVLQSQATTSAVVRPANLTDPTNYLSGVAIPGGLTQVLNPAGCGGGTVAASNDEGTYCTQDVVNQYGVIQPAQRRIGVTARLTKTIGDNAEAYLIGTYYQNREYFIGAPSGTNDRQPYTIRGLVLPAVLANGQINPQDPYANQFYTDPTTGQTQRQSALLNYRFGGIANDTTTKNQTYRIAGGIQGSFGDGWNYTADATYMRSVLDIRYRGLLNYAALSDAVNNGTYNFVDPSQNSAEQTAALSPDVNARATSKLWQAQGTISKTLFDLPGGPLQLAIGGQVRYENINDPVQDPVGADGRYTTVGINTFSAVGHRYIEAGFFELDAPILKSLEANVSGRFDHYSEGFDHFSPKVDVKFTPIRELALRGTFSKGFRAPSIPESQGNVIGYVNLTPPASVKAEHGNNGYVATQSVGEFTTGNPDLKPELSTSFTGGAILQPTRWLSLTADFYHIKKSRVIIGGDFQSAINAYYAGDAIPAGYEVVQNPADPAHPDATRTIQYVNAFYQNAQSLKTSGLDFSGTVNLRISPDVRLVSSLDATYVINYNLRTADGVQRYAGTVGPYNITSGAGTPRWRGTWQNTLEFGRYSVTAVAYYTSGYKDIAEDISGSGAAGDCAYAADLSASLDGSSPTRCRIKRFIDVDLTGNVKVNDKFSFYANVINVFDAKPPFDPAQYSANNYNPAYAQTGIIGRFFRVGANFKF